MGLEATAAVAPVAVEVLLVDGGLKTTICRWCLVRGALEYILYYAFIDREICAWALCALHLQVASVDSQPRRLSKYMESASK